MNAIRRAVLILVLLLPWRLKAQTDVDVIHLKNGSQFEGKILEYLQGSMLRLELRSGGEIEFREEEIGRIEQGWESSKTDRQETVSIPPPKGRAYAFKENGVYNATYFSTLSGSVNKDFQLGLGIHNVTGYQLHRVFGLGFGFGVDTYSFDNGETLYPVFAEARGYLSQKRVSPYYSGSLGYGFAFRNSDEFINKANGGLFYRAALGLRLGADKDTNVLADIGYQYQQAFFERRTEFQNEIEEKRLEFNRIAIRIGLIF
ncbi:MAG: hypothetical protein H6573_16775 [Lewinellaceae bacterium]|nr:hypothetical protein [Phaeodactylibacter sp.]MCB9349141.1 hypothetical protein [Lewinellaceae bacterium]